MTKKKRNAPDLEFMLARPWCYYCEKDFDDLKILIGHQKAKHFKCESCGRRLNTAGGLSVHLSQVHKENLAFVANALENRKDASIEVFGMEGIPKEILETHNSRITTEYFRWSTEHRALTGNPAPGSGAAPPAKKIKVETSEELKARLAAHKAKKAAEKAAGGVPSKTNTPLQASSPAQQQPIVGPPGGAMSTPPTTTNAYQPPTMAGSSPAMPAVQHPYLQNNAPSYGQPPTPTNAYQPSTMAGPPPAMPGGQQLYPQNNAFHYGQQPTLMNAYQPPTMSGSPSGMPGFQQSFPQNNAFTSGQPHLPMTPVPMTPGSYHPQRAPASHVPQPPPEGRRGGDTGPNAATGPNRMTRDLQIAHTQPSSQNNWERGAMPHFNGFSSSPPPQQQLQNQQPPRQNSLPSVPGLPQRPAFDPPSASRDEMVAMHTGNYAAGESSRAEQDRIRAEQDRIIRLNQPTPSSDDIDELIHEEIAKNPYYATLDGARSPIPVERSRPKIPDHRAPSPEPVESASSLAPKATKKSKKEKTKDTDRLAYQLDMSPEERLSTLPQYSFTPPRNDKQETVMGEVGAAVTGTVAGPDDVQDMHA